MDKEKIKSSIKYLIPVLAIVLPWFLKPGYLFFPDFVFGPNLDLDISSNWFLFQALMIPLTKVIPAAFVQKLILTAVFAGLLYAGKTFCEKFSENPWHVYLASLFFLFNPFIYDRMMYGQIGMLGSAIFLVLALSEMIDYTRKDSPKTKDLLKLMIFSALSIQLTPQLLFLYPVAMVIPLSYLVIEKRDSYKVWLKHLLYVVLAMIGLNIFWLISYFIPAANSSLSFQVDQYDFLAFRTSGRTIWEAVFNVISLSGFWGKDQFRYIDLTSIKEIWPKSFLLLLPVFFLGFFELYDKNVKKVYLYISGVIFFTITILSLGMSTPFTESITRLLFENFSPYKALRDTQKWSALLIPFYGVLLIHGVGFLFKIKKIADYKFILNMYLLGTIIMYSPLLLYGLVRQIEVNDYPSGWYEVDTYIAEQTDCKNIETVFFPWHLYMGFKFSRITVANPAPQFFRCPVLISQDPEFAGAVGTPNAYQEKVTKWIETEGGEINLADLGLRYIILAKEVDWQLYGWLDENDGYELIKELEHIRLYEIK